jgi:hypothetical protein
MTEQQAMRVLLMRSIETTTPQPGAWNDADRRWATESAAREVGAQASDETFLEFRAAQVLKRLRERSTAVGRVIGLASWHTGPARLLIALSLLIGLATDSIGDARRINLLAPPIWGVLAWNLFAYAMLLAGALGGARSAASAPGGPLVRGFHAALGALSSFPSTAFRRPRQRGSDPDLEAALHRFTVEWARSSALLASARLAGLMHLCALFLATGVLAGMYLRGLAWEYRAGWESTFLDADSLVSMLNALLGLASLLSGIELPDATRLESIRFPDSKGAPAGPWIHLFAITAMLVVIIPRGALWLHCRRREQSLTKHFPIDLEDAWSAALGRARRGEATRILMIQHGSSVEEPSLTALRALIGHASGGAVTLETMPAVAYGDEDLIAPALHDSSSRDLILVCLASIATPEEDTHGVLLDSILKRIASDRPILVIVDETAFIERFGASLDPSSRRSQRRSAWTRMLSPRPIRFVFVDLAAREPVLEKQTADLRQAMVEPALAR